MRATLALLLSLLFASIWAQTGELPKGLFLEMRPDIWMRVKEHRMGPEAVSVTVLTPDYPPELLRSQIDAIGKNLGTAARVLEIKQDVDPKDKKRYTSAQFSVDGLIDREGEKFRLQPVARAFAGAPEPYTVDGIHVTFENEVGYPNDVAEYTLPEIVRVEVQRTTGGLPMLEYRIQLLVQDPTAIVIPEKHDVTPAVKTDEPEQTSRTLFYVLLGVAALAAGALVYLALLRVSPRGR